ncbi:MAG: DUF2334 domain-containing protein [Desulfurivibrionaceae bacterium]
MKTNVFITIDTENSIGGAFENQALKPVGRDKRIYGRVKGREYGIPLIMDIADSYGVPLTFFVEVLNKYYFGEEETCEVCRYILDRGHDIQLHLHPNFLNFKETDPALRRYGDNMSSYDLATQSALIAEGKELLTRYCGWSPVAFRAGNYGADCNTLKALKSNGLYIDSSYNAAFPRQRNRITKDVLNDVIELEGVREFPITNFIEAIPFRKNRFKPLDLNGVSYGEMRAVLERAHVDQKPKNVTFILHSFSFIEAYDVQYQSCRPRKYVVERFESLCRFLKENSNIFWVRNFNEFAKNSNLNISVEDSKSFCSVSTIDSVLRVIENKFK